MTDLSDSINKIYQLLYKDPDYQDTPNSTREEQIWGEATQRAKQHERNNIALSLAKSSAITDFANFLSKAEGAPQPSADILLEAFNPRQGSLNFLDPLKVDVALTPSTRAVPSVLPNYVSDLETILDKTEEHEKFNKSFKTRFKGDEAMLRAPDAMTALRQQLDLLRAYMTIETMVKTDKEYSADEILDDIRNGWEAKNKSLTFGSPEALDALLAPIEEELGSGMIRGGFFI